MTLKEELRKLNEHVDNREMQNRKFTDQAERNARNKTSKRNHPYKGGNQFIPKGLHIDDEDDDDLVGAVLARKKGDRNLTIPAVKMAWE